MTDHGSDARVLVVDDDAGLRSLMRVALEAAGCEVEEAANGLDAIALFGARRPDLVFLDVVMPDLDGFGACREIRKLPGSEHTPIVMVTGLDDIESIDRAYEAGATDFITKPINWAILGHRVRYIHRASLAERNAAEAHAKLVDAVACFPGAFCLFDSQDRLELCNEKAVEFAPELAELLQPGISYQTIARASAMAGFSADPGAGGECGPPAHHGLRSAFRHDRQDGRSLHIIERKTSCGGIVAVWIDITEINEREKALQAAKEAAETASRAKSEFLAAMSHELRTPLNAIIGFSDIMQGELLGPLGSPQYQAYAEDIRRSGTHLLSLINNILDIAKLQTGSLAIDEVDVDLAAMLEEALAAAGAQASASRVVLEVELDGALPRFRGDRRKLRQMFDNVFSNAVRFTLPGGRVQVTASKAADQALIVSVSDTGIGIAPDDIPKALSPFGQVDSNLSRRYDGTGLGLPLAVAYCELHQGTLTLASQLDVGTTVTLQLPGERFIEPQPRAAARLAAG